MGFDASTWDGNFVVPQQNVAAALAAMNAEYAPGPGREYETLSDAVEANTSYVECREDDETGFRLGYHEGRYSMYTQEVLSTLAPFAIDGSFERLSGQEESLWGFRVVAGELKEETGDVVWRLDDPPPEATPE